MMKIHPQKNTLLQAAQGNAETKAYALEFAN